MTDRLALSDQVRATMASVFGVRAETLPPALVREQYPKWDSLNHVTLIVALEEQFGVQFSLRDIGAIASLDDLVTCLEASRAAAVS
jgi:acyl carrier protein